MKNYYLFAFIDEEMPNCGEEFLVTADSRHDAIERAYNLFPGTLFVCYGLMNGFQAERLGVDTY